MARSIDEIMAEATHAYIGRGKCGCIIAVTTDVPDMRKETAADVAEFVRGGLSVERVTLDDFRRMPFGCKCPKQPDPQGSLFGEVAHA